MMRRFGLVAAVAIAAAFTFVLVSVYSIQAAGDPVAWACQYWIQVGSQKLCFMGR